MSASASHPREVQVLRLPRAGETPLSAAEIEHGIAHGLFHERGVPAGYALAIQAAQRQAVHRAPPAAADLPKHMRARAQGLQHHAQHL